MKTQDLGYHLPSPVREMHESWLVFHTEAAGLSLQRSRMPTPAAAKDQGPRSKCPRLAPGQEAKPLLRLVAGRSWGEAGAQMLPAFQGRLHPDLSSGSPDAALPTPPPRGLAALGFGAHLLGT